MLVQLLLSLLAVYVVACILDVSEGMVSPGVGTKLQAKLEKEKKNKHQQIYGRM